MIVQDVHYKFLASSLLGFNLPAGYNDNPFISLFQLYLTRWVGNHQLCPEGFASLVKSDRFFKRSQPMQHDTWNLGTKLQGWSRDPTLHLIINHFIFDQRTAAEWVQHVLCHPYFFLVIFKVAATSTVGRCNQYPSP